MGKKKDNWPNPNTFQMKSREENGLAKGYISS